MIYTFPPRYLAMAGIAAGIRAECDIGDVILADPVWDWGSGKIAKQQFYQAPHQISTNSFVRGKAASMAADAASLDEKLASLKFLGHWVGDIHQPRHVSFEDDRGGNNVLVTGECGSNLHSAWDTCLVVKAVGEDVDQAATELLKSITPAKIEGWTRSEPKDWANESFAIAERAQTKYCIRQGASCDHPSGKVQIDAAYVAVNTRIVREKLQKSGVRLAHLLDAALGK
jgi:hypothetical protein